MPATGVPPISPYSAALTIVQWIQQHGREPHKYECRPANGLLSYMTYYRHFHGAGFSAIVSHAIDVVATYQPPFPPQNNTPRTAVRCLCCDTFFASDSRAVRICRSCKQRQRYNEEFAGDDVFLEHRDLWAKMRRAMPSPDDDIDWS